MREAYQPIVDDVFRSAGLRCNPAPDDHQPLVALDSPTSPPFALAGVRDNWLVGTDFSGSALATYAVDGSSLAGIDATSDSSAVLAAVLDTRLLEPRTLLLGRPPGVLADVAELPWQCARFDRSNNFVVAVDLDQETLVVVDVTTEEAREVPEVDATAPRPAGCASFVDDSSLVVNELNDASRVVVAQVELDSGESSLIFESDTCNSIWPDADPDGDRVAFATGCVNPCESGLLIADLASGDIQTIAHAPLSAPRWSPDGEWIAFMLQRTDDDPGIDLWVVRADGSDAQLAIPDASWPIWLDLEVLVESDGG